MPDVIAELPLPPAGPEVAARLRLKRCQYQARLPTLSERDQAEAQVRMLAYELIEGGSVSVQSLAWAARDRWHWAVPPAVLSETVNHVYLLIATRDLANPGLPELTLDSALRWHFAPLAQSLRGGDPTDLQALRPPAAALSATSNPMTGCELAFRRELTRQLAEGQAVQPLQLAQWAIREALAGSTLAPLAAAWLAERLASITAEVGKLISGPALIPAFAEVPEGIGWSHQPSPTQQDGMRQGLIRQLHPQDTIAREYLERLSSALQRGPADPRALAMALLREQVAQGAPIRDLRATAATLAAVARTASITIATIERSQRHL